jgi:cytidylate kinase
LGKRIVVAIDGPAGAGKSTIARRIADRLGFLYIDTGAMYRAVALWAIETGVAMNDMHRLEQLAVQARIEFMNGASTVFLNGRDVTDAVRQPEVSAAASKVAAAPGVRRALVSQQRAMSAMTSVVMEGRDIGSVVFPEADVKIFLDASTELRAQRRLSDLEASGESADPSEVARAMEERDRRDMTRAESPLVQAPDAVYLDTSGKSIEEVEEALLKIVRERTSNGKELHR